MKLSEAMMLGSATCQMVEGNWNTCALGAAATAAGVRLYLDDQWNDDGDLESLDDREREIVAMWPWIDNPTTPPEELRDPTWKEAIFNRFDDGVCKGGMTFEALVDYVRSIEPECNECNRFECSCQKASAKESISEAVSQ
jgi:hypothetical protein